MLFDQFENLLFVKLSSFLFPSHLAQDNISQVGCQLMNSEPLSQVPKAFPGFRAKGIATVASDDAGFEMDLSEGRLSGAGDLARDEAV